MRALPPSSGAMALSLRDVTVRHAGAAAASLSAVSLDILPGEQVALIGPSGAGKTTLLSVAGAALRPAGGMVRIQGKDPWAQSGRTLRALRAGLFLAPQAPPLPPRQRVVTSVLAGRLPVMGPLEALVSLLRPADPARAAEALARFGLERKLWERVDRLSGGERQRVSLARLVVSEARFLLVDEPLSALDPALAGRTLEALRRTATERGGTLLCSLHQVELARRHFPRVVGLRDGTVLFDRRDGTLSDEDVARLYHDRDADSPLPEPDLPGGPTVTTGRCL